MFAAVRVVRSGKKCTSKLRQHHTHIARSCVSSLEETANTALLGIHSTHCHHERAEIRPVERAVDVCAETVEFGLRGVHREVVWRTVHILDHTSRALDDRLAVAPRYGSSQQTADLDILASRE